MIRIYKVHRENKLELTLTVVFQIIHIVFSLDFGFLRQKSWKIKLAINVLSVIRYFGIAIWSVNKVFAKGDTGEQIWLGGLLLQYIVSFGILLSIKNKATFCHFFSEFLQIDLRLEINDACYKLEFKVFMSIMFSLVTRSIYSLSLCLFQQKCMKPYWIAVIYAWLNVSTELVAIANTFIFYLVYCRLKTFVSILKHASARSDFASYQYLYKLIIDVAQKYKTVYDKILLTTILFNIPRLMSSMYFAITDVLNGISPVLFTRFFTHIQMFIMMIAPAMAAGMITSKMDEIRIILHEKWLQLHDEPQEEDIKQFINYVEARPCRFRLYNVIPLDADLLKMVLSFCVTYLIVVLQLTHVY